MKIQRMFHKNLSQKSLVWQYTPPLSGGFIHQLYWWWVIVHRWDCCVMDWGGFRNCRAENLSAHLEEMLRGTFQEETRFSQKKAIVQTMCGWRLKEPFRKRMWVVLQSFKNTTYFFNQNIMVTKFTCFGGLLEHPVQLLRGKSQVEKQINGIIRYSTTILLTVQKQPMFILKRHKINKKMWELAQYILTVFEITQQLAAQLAIPMVHSVNSLGHVPLFHYWIIGQHSGPSPGLLLLPRERWKSYWSCVWISDQSPQISPQGWGRNNRWRSISLWLYLY